MPSQFIDIIIVFVIFVIIYNIWKNNTCSTYKKELNEEFKEEIEDTNDNIINDLLKVTTTNKSPAPKYENGLVDLTGRITDIKNNSNTKAIKVQSTEIVSNDDTLEQNLEERRFKISGNNIPMNDIKKYLQDYVLEGRLDKSEPIDVAQMAVSDDTIEKYRKENFESLDKFNQSSKNDIDPVDRVNLQELNGGIQADGMTIGEYYDKLVSIK